MKMKILLFITILGGSSFAVAQNSVFLVGQRGTSALFSTLTGEEKLVVRIQGASAEQLFERADVSTEQPWESGYVVRQKGSWFCFYRPPRHPISRFMDGVLSRNNREVDVFCESEVDPS